jgi:choline kinase
MQAIILAAGLSKRLRPLTDNMPKCLIKVGEKTILQMTIDNILKNNINEFIMVTGYKENMIKDFISDNYPGLNIKYITNPGYENNNNSYSLWMTKEYIKSDSILLDSDILFDFRIISSLLESGKIDCLAVITNHKLGEEEIKVIIDSTNKILHIGKNLNPKDCFGESIGIEKFSYEFFRKLGDVLERKIVKEGNVNEFYEASFQELYNGRNSMYAIDVSKYRCMEIDFPEDLTRANQLIKEIN